MLEMEFPCIIGHIALALLHLAVEACVVSGVQRCDALHRRLMLGTEFVCILGVYALDLLLGALVLGESLLLLVRVGAVAQLLKGAFGVQAVAANGTAFRVVEGYSDRSGAAAGISLGRGIGR